eukprot:SAG22_NODE_413_length_10849_cov_6.078977_2_plen_322_part_00
MPAAINEKKSKIAARVAGKILSTGSHIIEATLAPVTTMGNVRRALMAEAYGAGTVAALDLLATDIELLDALMESICDDETIMPPDHRLGELVRLLLAPARALLHGTLAEMENGASKTLKELTNKLVLEDVGLDVHLDKAHQTIAWLQRMLNTHCVVCSRAADKPELLHKQHCLATQLLTRMASHKGVVGITVAPTSKETLVVGDAVTIGWAVTGWVVKQVRLSIVDDEECHVIADSLPAEQTSYTWTPSPDLQIVKDHRLGTSGHRFKFEVTAIDDDGDDTDDAAVEGQASGCAPSPAAARPAPPRPAVFLHAFLAARLAG